VQERARFSGSCFLIAPKADNRFNAHAGRLWIIHIRSGLWWLRERDTGMRPYIESVVAITVLLLQCSLVAGCTHRAVRFELPQVQTAQRNVYPWRVGVASGKEFLPYKITYRYWSTTPLTWSLEGLPDAFVTTLRPYFLSVDALQVTQDLSTTRRDLFAKMSVDQIHFNGANTTGLRDTVDLTMTFILEQPNGTEVFQTTLSVSASGRYIQRCALCKPDPPEAFTNAFSAMFVKLSEALTLADIRFVQEEEL
jgi:hypothetical protein